MDDRHVMRLIKAAEKIATDLDRIAGALEAANAADPVKLIGDALATDDTERRFREVIGMTPAEMIVATEAQRKHNAEVQETAQNGDPLAHVPESERYRFQ